MNSGNLHHADSVLDTPIIDLSAYRDSAIEQSRVGDLMGLLPDGLRSALDIGARDGYLSRKLRQRVSRVVALDLERPLIDDADIECVQGDATALAYADGTFDLLLCAEVLEHLPGPLLERACAELGRVAGGYVLIGVPYKQDLRLDRSTCQQCGAKNPPWGHVNRFDERRLAALFPDYQLVRHSFIGTAAAPTNALSCWLMDLAGNPYGTYRQNESCVACGQAMGHPPPRTLLQKCLTRAAVYTRKPQTLLARHPNWIHVLLKKKAVEQTPAAQAATATAGMA